MSGGATLARLALRERIIILLTITGVTALSWLYLLQLGHGMAHMASMAMPMSPRWTPAAFGLTFAMWVVMMVGMMLPSAAPMILTFATLHQRKAGAVERLVPTLLFASGYLLAWSGFSLFATMLQWALDRVALVSPMPSATSATLGGAVFLLAGAYQITPLKQACMRHCRSPFAFLFNRWQGGWKGALRMGAEHGAYCLGCCWLLMALLFVVGVMNLLWVATITLFVFGEKLLHSSAWITRISGVALAGYGIWLAVHT
jgi:predicted metal-binding membrane protein